MTRRMPLLHLLSTSPLAPLRISTQAKAQAPANEKDSMAEEDGKAIRHVKEYKIGRTAPINVS